jgi:hypothetical protein
LVAALAKQLKLARNVEINVAVIQLEKAKI